MDEQNLMKQIHKTCIHGLTLALKNSAFLEISAILSPAILRMLSLVSLEEKSFHIHLKTQLSDQWINAEYKNTSI